MTPGTPPRIIFLLVAPAACSLTAGKDTWVEGGRDCWGTGREKQDAAQEAARHRLPRLTAAMPLSGFPASTHCVIHVLTSSTPSEQGRAPDQ